MAWMVLMVWNAMRALMVLNLEPKKARRFRGDLVQFGVVRTKL
jgi:hypothetical protein